VRSFVGDDRGLDARLFTLEEANAVLTELRPFAEEMVVRRRALAEALAVLERVAATAAGNGGGLSAAETSAAAERARVELEAIARCVQTITDAGVQVKDLDTGLLDFPSRREGEEVLLCWRVGEDEIQFWHGLEEGFAGRKPL
jgi:hypothetical protein